MPIKEEAKEPLTTHKKSKAAPGQAMKDVEAETNAKKQAEMASPVKSKQEKKATAVTENAPAIETKVAEPVVEVAAADDKIEANNANQDTGRMEDHLAN